MRDNVRLMITGIVAVGALAWTIGGSGLSFSIGNDAWVAQRQWPQDQHHI